MPSQLPEPGDVLAAEVVPGCEVLFRVLAAHGPSRCVVATRAFGPPLTKPPRAKAVFEVQPHQHHGVERPMIGGWMSDGPPAAFRPLGRLPLRPGEAEQVCHPEVWTKLPPVERARLRLEVLPTSAWLTVLNHARAQWRWDHQRAVVLAEDAARERTQQDALKAALQAQAKSRARLEEKGVAALVGKRFFAAWKGSLPAALIKDAEAELKAAVTALQGKSPAQAARRLVSLVKRFNQLDGRHGHSFDTTDAEDIMEAIGTLALACRVDDETFDEVIDAARTF